MVDGNIVLTVLHLLWNSPHEKVAFVGRKGPPKYGFSFFIHIFLVV